MDAAAANESIGDGTPTLSALTTLVDGDLASVAEAGGDMLGGLAGLYHRDVRVLSRLTVRVDGQRPQLVASGRSSASASEVVQVAGRDAAGDATMLLRRSRVLAGGLEERLLLQVFASTSRPVELRVELAADFEDLPTLHAGTGPASPASVPLGPDGDALVAEAGRSAVRAIIEGADDRGSVAIEPGAFTVSAVVGPGEQWEASLRITPLFDGQASRSTRRRSSRVDVAGSDERWAPAMRTAVDDVDALRVEVPELEIAYVAAGAPFYLALFGRDALLTAWSALPLGWELALENLTALAGRQGERHDARTLEEPGRILHELRTGGAGVFGLPPETGYYGTVDATPLFVMLLAETLRWGAPSTLVRDLLPAARRAVAWCIDHGDRDGDGFIEYVADPHGARHQGWRDSRTAFDDARGVAAAGPIAVAEAQAYLYGALVGLAQLEERVGIPGNAPELRARAAALRGRFLEHFWLEDAQLLATALDGDKEPITRSASSMGHCLWTGLLDADDECADVTAGVVRRLLADDLGTRWGIRTMAASADAYNPLSYHRGSIWPHDTAIVAEGLGRVGAADGARAVIERVLALAEHLDWRLPELVSGVEALPWPVAYADACVPQAWSAAAPLSLLRTVLGLEPDVPAGVVHCAPILPDDGVLHVRGVRIGSGALDLTVRGAVVDVLAAPSGVRVVQGERGESSSGV